MVNCYKSDFAIRDRLGNKYLTFAEMQSFCSDRNKPYTLIQRNTVTAGVGQEEILTHVVSAPHRETTLALTVLTNTNTAERHSHWFVHFMSLWSNRLKKYDELKVVSFFKKKALCPLHTLYFLVSCGFTSSSPFHLSLTFIWTASAAYAHLVTLFIRDIHASLGIWFLP